MKAESLRACIALTLIPTLGAQRITRLVKAVGSAENVFQASPAELLRIDGVGKQTVQHIKKFDDWKQVDRILEITEKPGFWLMDYYDEAYPERLRHIYDPPILLWGKGDKKALSKPGLAVIGTRNVTRYGRAMTEKFTAALTESGLSIISGLALGVDTLAHEVALGSGGVTTGVLGSGIDWIYPAVNKNLADRMVESGSVVISEFPPGTKPDAVNFPVRNRIVSGLSLGTLVIESDVTGGSMITANLSLEQGREVFLVPHNLDNPFGRGVNALIKKGAGKLVQNSEDILCELEVHLPGLTGDSSSSNEMPSKKWQEMDLSPKQRKICEALAEQDALTADAIFEKTEIKIVELLPVLLELELENVVEPLSGNRFRLK